MLLNVIGLSKSFGPKVVLNSLSFTVNHGDRIGLVGSNGVGKTTLLRIVAGLDCQDSGSVAFGPSARVGYLPQSVPESFDGAVEELILESVDNLWQLSRRIETVEAELVGAEGDHLSQLLEEYGALTTEFQHRGGYDLDHRIDTVMVGLGLDHISRDRKIATVSGGEKARFGLAALLLRSPNLLLLDEPTNHLDVVSLEWLEEYLSQQDGGLIVVSHDRAFLNRVVTRILEIDEYTHQVKSYEGSYDDYRLAKAAERRRWEADYQRQQGQVQELKRRVKTSIRQTSRPQPIKDNDKLLRNFKAGRVQKALSGDIRAAREQLERIEANPIPKPPKTIEINADFGSPSVRSRVVMEATHIRKRFGERQILDDINMVVQPSSRITIIGENGCGKTTLLRILVGLDEPDEGAVRRVEGLKLSYLPQEPWLPEQEKTVLEVYRQSLTGYVDELIRDLLHHGLFRFEDLDLPVGRLSLGQQRRLEIARMIAAQPQMLILDEPTNYLSLDVLEEFETALRSFPGPVIAVSHDRWFIEKFGGSIYLLDRGHLSSISSFNA